MKREIILKKMSKDELVSLIGKLDKETQGRVMRRAFNLINEKYEKKLNAILDEGEKYLKNPTKENLDKYDALMRKHDALYEEWCEVTS